MRFPRIPKVLVDGPTLREFLHEFPIVFLFFVHWFEEELLFSIEMLVHPIPHIILKRLTRKIKTPNSILSCIIHSFPRVTNAQIFTIILSIKVYDLWTYILSVSALHFNIGWDLFYAMIEWRQFRLVGVGARFDDGGRSAFIIIE